MTESIRFHRIGDWVDRFLGTGLIESIELIQNIQKRSTKSNDFSGKVNEIDGVQKTPTKYCI